MAQIIVTFSKLLLEDHKMNGTLRRAAQDALCEMDGHLRGDDDRLQERLDPVACHQRGSGIVRAGCPALTLR